MSGFLYFLPHAPSVIIVDGVLSRERLQAHKLDDVLADVLTVPDDCIATPTTQGPDGAAGTVLVPLSPGVPIPRVPAYDPESQAWHNVGDYWIGYEGTTPPPPAHFARKQPVLGYWVPDGHGRTWLVPLVRGIDRPYGALPCDFTFGPDFLPAEVLRGRYRKLWDDSARMWDAYDEDGLGVPDEFCASFAARCLAINYRLGHHELNLFAQLGHPVLGRDNVIKFGMCACDARSVFEYREQQKKTPALPVPSGIVSTPGSPVAIPTGVPRVANYE